MEWWWTGTLLSDSFKFTHELFSRYRNSFCFFLHSSNSTAYAMHEAALFIWNFDSESLGYFVRRFCSFAETKAKNTSNDFLRHRTLSTSVFLNAWYAVDSVCRWDCLHLPICMLNVRYYLRPFERFQPSHSFKLDKLLSSIKCGRCAEKGSQGSAVHKTNKPI